MRTVFGLILAGALMLGHSNAAQAQGVSAPNGYRYSRGYAFKDEPLMSINRSYLGYSNFVSYGPDPALGASTTYNASRARQSYVRAPAPAPAPVRRGFRLFGGRRGYRY